jgi:hypothetical protein
MGDFRRLRPWRVCSVPGKRVRLKQLAGAFFPRSLADKLPESRWKSVKTREGPQGEN